MAQANGRTSPLSRTQSLRSFPSVHSKVDNGPSITRNCRSQGVNGSHRVECAFQPQDQDASPIDECCSSSEHFRMWQQLKAELQEYKKEQETSIANLKSEFEMRLLSLEACMAKDSQRVTSVASRVDGLLTRVICPTHRCTQTHNGISKGTGSIASLQANLKENVRHSGLENLELIASQLNKWSPRKLDEACSDGKLSASHNEPFASKISHNEPLASKMSVQKSGVQNSGVQNRNVQDSAAQNRGAQNCVAQNNGTHTCCNESFKRVSGILAETAAMFLSESHEDMRIEAGLLLRMESVFNDVRKAIHSERGGNVPSEFMRNESTDRRQRMGMTTHSSTCPGQKQVEVGQPMTTNSFKLPCDLLRNLDASRRRLSGCDSGGSVP